MTVVRGAKWKASMSKEELSSMTSTLCTDEAFSQIKYSRHQNGSSPLIGAGIPCVSAFVLDYMHTICLGVVSRLLVNLTRSPKLCRLSVRQKIEVGQVESHRVPSVSFLHGTHSTQKYCLLTAVCSFCDIDRGSIHHAGLRWQDKSCLFGFFYWTDEALCV